MKTSPSILTELQQRSHRAGAIMESFLDRQLIPRVAKKERLEDELARRLFQSRDAVQDMPESWFNWIASQYFAHRLFRKEGLALSYLPILIAEGRSGNELDFTRQRISRPWRFSFCRQLDDVRPDFHVMLDLLDGREFLLYSPALTRMNDDVRGIRTFFLLLDDLEVGYQTYGPIMYFLGLDFHDVMYLGRLLDERAVTSDAVAALIDHNPAPFMALARGAEIPLVVHGQEALVHHRLTVDVDAFVPDQFSRTFQISSRGAVTRLELKRWSKHPHFATMYHDAGKNSLQISAMTSRAFIKLRGALEAAGYTLPANEERIVSMGFLGLTHSIAGISSYHDPYEALFAEALPSPEMQQELDRLNRFLELYMTAQNAGRKPDVDALARMCEIDVDIARWLVESIGSRLSKKPSASKRSRLRGR